MSCHSEFENQLIPAVTGRKGDIARHFFLLTHSLSPKLSSDARESLREMFSSQEISWPLLLSLANNLLVTGALYSSLKKTDLLPYLPLDVRNFLGHIYSENERRNLALKEQVTQTVGELLSLEIQPVLLKGAVTLFESPVKSIGARMMADIDMLVHPDSLALVEDCLIQLDYEPRIIESMWQKHDQVFVHHNRVAAIDIHRSVGPQSLLLPVNEAFAGAVPITDQDDGLLALSPTHRILHNVFHSEIQDRNYLFGRVSIASLSDFASIVCSGKPVDWSMVSERIGRYSRNVLVSYVYSGNQLLSTPIPDGLEPNANARRHFSRCVKLLSRRRARRLLTFADRFSAPLKRTYIGFTYSCEESRYLRTYFRAVHFISFVKRNGWGAFRKLAHRFSYFRASIG